MCLVRRGRSLAVALMVFAASVVSMPAVGAQEEAPDSFWFDVYASICEDAVAPNDDCSPWAGVTINVALQDGSLMDSCVTETWNEFVAGCTVEVPWGSQVTAKVVDSGIPAGHEVVAIDPTWDIPPGAPGGITGNPYFMLIPFASAPTDVPAQPTAVPVEPTEVPGRHAEPVQSLPTTGVGGQHVSQPKHGVLMFGTTLLLLMGTGVVNLKRSR